MRWLILLLIALLAVWYFLPAQDPVPVEESYIAEPVGTLREAEAYEAEYLKQAEERQRRLEEAIDGDG